MTGYPNRAGISDADFDAFIAKHASGYVAPTPRETFAPADGIAAGVVLKVDSSRTARVLYGRAFGSTEWQLVPLTRMVQGYGVDSPVWAWLRAHGFRHTKQPAAHYARPNAAGGMR